MFGKTFRLFEIFGIPIKIDWSWSILFLLVTWSLAEGWFPFVLADDYGAMVHWGLGVLGALGLVGSIVLHEVGHALVAGRNGVPMRGITLFIFGGVAEMTSEPPNAGAEFRIAIAGPVVSAVLGAVFLGAAALAGGSPIARATLGYLGMVNLVLLAFNLVPGFPLDGGRVLRAALWARRESLAEATRIAGAVGSAVGFGLMFLGLIILLGGDLIGGIWFGLIGLFLRGAAGSAYRRVLLRDMFTDQPIGSFVEPDVVAAGPGTPVRDLVEQIVYGLGQEVIPIVSDGRLVGSVTLEQIGEASSDRWSFLTAGDIMRPVSEETLVTPEEDAAQLLMRGTANRNGLRSRLMVVEGGDRFVGLVRIENLMKLFRLRMELEPPTKGEEARAWPRRSGVTRLV